MKENFVTRSQRRENPHKPNRGPRETHKLLKRSKTTLLRRKELYGSCYLPYSVS